MHQATDETLGLFPLNIAVLPKEQTRLHIFEPKYKQLINDCFANGLDFGIPFVQNGQVTAYGTQVKLVDIERFYPDGKMDILVEGFRIIKVKKSEFYPQNKLYTSGDIKVISQPNLAVTKADLFKLFVAFERKTNTPSIKYGFDAKADVYDIANSLKLNNETKFKLLTSTSPSYIQNVLINELRMVLTLLEQEDELENRFLLN